MLSSTPAPTFASTSNLDLEAQRERASSLSSLIPVVTHASWTAPSEMIHPMDSRFGYTSLAPTRGSRHDQRRSLSDVPPPYAEEASIVLPEYTLHAPEPITLAMYLFKFGFLFPPFWFFGAFVLLSPLREPPTTYDDTPAWMPEKTEAERKEMIASLRQVEVKWAKRCLCAVIVLTVLAIGGYIAAWLALRQ